MRSGPKPLSEAARPAQDGPVRTEPGGPVATPLPRPLLVLWETTKACPLHCRHCRATAVPMPSAGELTTAEAKGFLDGLRDEGDPAPVVVFSGGDCLQRPDLLELVEHARSRGARTALSPSVSPSLNDETMDRLAAAGVRQVSISLDGGRPETHDDARGEEGHFAATRDAIGRLAARGFNVQVNTTVMRRNALELARVAFLLETWGVRTWEVFFLVDVGRAAGWMELAPDELEDVCSFLADVAERGLVVRTVEGPFYRRVVEQRRQGRAEAPQRGALYATLSGELNALMAPATVTRLVRPPRTADGMGIVFVSHDGDVYPSGFLPRRVGSVRTDRLIDVYKSSPELRAIRERRFSGACGRCEYAEICGGSRARAYAAYGDFLAEDPACVRSDAWGHMTGRPPLPLLAG